MQTNLIELLNKLRAHVAADIESESSCEPEYVQDARNLVADIDLALTEILTDETADKTDANRWRAFVNASRVSLFGWAGYERAPSDDPLSNYRHFGADFWSIHDAPMSDVEREQSSKILIGFADSCVKYQSLG